MAHDYVLETLSLNPTPPPQLKSPIHGSHKNGVYFILYFSFLSKNTKSIIKLYITEFKNGILHIVDLLITLQGWCQQKLCSCTSSVY